MIMRWENCLLKSLDWLCKFSLFGSILAILILLGGCSHVPIMSMVKLSQLDPMQSDPAHMRVAMRSPDWLRIAHKGAVLHLGTDLPNKPKENLDETFQLIESPDLPLPAELANEVAISQHMALLRIAPQDLPRLYETKNKIRHLKKVYGDSHSYLSVNVKGCRLHSTTSPAQSRPLVTIYLKISPKEPFIPLVRNVDLAQQTSGKSLTDLPACADQTSGVR